MLKKAYPYMEVCFFYKSSHSFDIEVEIHDVFSNGDCVQNGYFTASAFEATMNNFVSKHEEIRTLVIWVGNGPHYRNTSLILWLMRTILYVILACRFQ